MSPVSTRQYCCARSLRRDLVRAAVDAQGDPFLNGIDYLEVSPTDQQELTVRFLHPLPGQAGGVPAAPALTAASFVVDGGVRVRSVAVDAVVSTTGETIVLHTDRAGDFSTYTLRLVGSPAVSAAPAGFDPTLAAVDFSFKVGCEGDLDCAAAPGCPPPVEQAPRLGYLAKDYATFRRLILDRMAQVMPGWSERSPADLQVTLVEVLAYVADRLSYYQDSVATEAYLGTARRRTSVRRHARLVDYRVHEGANARAWLVFETRTDMGSPAAPAVPAGTAVTAGDPSGPPAQLVVFETMHDLPQLLVTRNAMAFYTWGDDDCCLPVGACRATLLGSPGLLDIARGDVLVFEEVLGAVSGLPQDADTTHRHAVRLSADPVARTDPLTGDELTDIGWFEQDALPFALCLRTFDDGAGGVRPAAVARGNVALADHGRTVAPAGPGSALTPPLVPVTGPYRPVLSGLDLTHAVPVDPAGAAQVPATESIAVDPRLALPAITLRGEGEIWQPRPDLLDSDRFATDFVVEMEQDRHAQLRFGDGVLGRSPSPGTSFVARYRLGAGRSGNVGAEALAALAVPMDGVTVRNPLAAAGGVDPEPLARVRLDAPQAFRTQDRAVTPADYAAAAGRHPDVSRAAATRRWTGSWYTMFVTADRRAGRPVDTAFETDLTRFLDRYRMAGYDLEVDPPAFVALQVALTICVLDHHDRARVELALRQALGSGLRSDGARGFFHPDNVTFGEPVYLSRLLACAAAVPGVSRVVSVDAFRRYGQDPHGEIEQGFVPIHRLEVARLDDDPSDPERGTLTLTMQGGI
ncbi:putative baseplate assembly protein [Intrasporangium sp.]|uniref:putative baseplate assembly protein n=1 Tax=Intrasporangium sp. TaxID=1925024 RepID=UPI0032218E52